MSVGRNVWGDDLRLINHTLSNTIATLVNDLFENLDGFLP